MLPIIKATELEQVAYVVHDVEKSAESMWINFGVGSWDIVSVPADFADKMTYRGKPGKFGFKAAITQQKVGGFEIELIEPTDGESTFRDFLIERGEGIHHMGWYRVKSLEEYENTARSLEQAGFTCLSSGYCSVVAFGYFDTVKVLKFSLEVMWMDVSRSIPPPQIGVIPR